MPKAKTVSMRAGTTMPGFRAKKFTKLYEPSLPELQSNQISYWYLCNGETVTDRSKSLLNLFSSEDGSMLEQLLISKLDGNTEKEAEIKEKITEKINDFKTNEEKSEKNKIDFTERDVILKEQLERLKSCVNAICKMKTLEQAAQDDDFSNIVNINALLEYKTVVDNYKFDGCDVISEFTELDFITASNRFLTHYPANITEKMEFLDSSNFSKLKFPFIPDAPDFNPGYLLFDNSGKIPESFKDYFIKLLVKLQEIMREINRAKYISPSKSIRDSIKLVLYKTSENDDVFKAYPDIINTIRQLVVVIYESESIIYKALIDGGITLMLHTTVNLVVDYMVNNCSKINVYKVFGQARTLLNTAISNAKSKLDGESASMVIEYGNYAIKLVDYLQDNYRIAMHAKNTPVDSSDSECE